MLPLYVVESAGPSLFGRSLLASIRSEWVGVYQDNDVYLTLRGAGAAKSVFEEGKGKLKGHEAKKSINSSARPWSW